MPTSRDSMSMSRILVSRHGIQREEDAEELHTIRSFELFGHDLLDIAES